MKKGEGLSCGTQRKTLEPYTLVEQETLFPKEEDVSRRPAQLTLGFGLSENLVLDF